MHAPEGGGGSTGEGRHGLSRSTIPSSAATNVASAVASFDTDAHSKRCASSPRAASARPVTTAATWPHCQSSIARRASTARDYRLERQLISSGAAFEERVGYSRAVRVGDHVWVSGTAPIMPGDADPPAGAYDQACVCLAIIAKALEEAGASLDAVVRTRIYVTEASLIDEVGRAHGEAFATARPATTGIVTQLLDPRWLVEIEAEAVDTSRVKQIFPPSITGKGAEGTGSSQPSVLDHAFGKSTRTHSASRRSTSCWIPRRGISCSTSTRCRCCRRRRHQDQIHAELMQSVLEVTTPVCRTAATYAVARAAARLRRELARSEGCRVGSAGTHPFSLFERQRITARDRYRQLVDQLQYVARRELIFGMHMHVAVDDPEKVIQVMNGLLLHLPQMLALSASSPFWRGEPTGLYSSRQMVFAAFPRSGSSSWYSSSTPSVYGSL